MRSALLRGGACLALLAMLSREALGAEQASERAQSLKEQQVAAKAFLDGLAHGQGPLDGASTRERMTRLAAMKAPGISAAQFQHAGSVSFQANEVIGAMGILAALAAQAVGSAAQAAQAALLEKYSGLLSGNANAELTLVSGILSREGQAVLAGDAVGADSIAREFAGISGATVAPGFVASAADLAMEGQLQDVVACDWASMWLALGQAVLAAVVGFIQGGIYGAIVALVLSLVVSAINGSFTSQTHSLQASNPNQADTAGAWAAQVGAAVVGGQVGKAVVGNSGQAAGPGQQFNGSLPTLNNVKSGAGNTQLTAPGGAASQNALPSAGTGN